MKTETIKEADFFQQLLKAGHEVLGEKVMAQLLPTFTNDVDFLPALNQLGIALRDTFGKPQALGTLLRIGRAFMRQLTYAYPEESGLFENSFRTLPKPRRLFKGMILIDNLLWKTLPVETTIADLPNHWYLQIKLCEPFAHDFDLLNFVGYFFGGMLQELMMWSTGGKYYPVTPQLESEGSFGLHIEKNYIS